METLISGGGLEARHERTYGARRLLSDVVDDFRRGDANADGSVDIADAICTLSYLFGAPDDPCKRSVPACLDAADANDDGMIDIADGISILGHLFGPAGPLPDPFETCGLDPPGDDFDCALFAPCE